MRTQKRNFTLVELLTVIAIIAVLAGILLPVLGKVKEKAKVTKAKSQMNGIIMAIKNYEATYGVLPGHTTGGSADDDIEAGTDVVIDYSDSDHKKAYDRLFDMLTCVNTTADSDTEDKTGWNSRKIPFLEAPSDFSKKSFLDPWGNRYVIVLDLDYNNIVDLNDDNSDDPPSTPVLDGAGTARDITGSVAVYSFGPDKGNDSGRTSGTGNDDVVSWE